MSLNDKHVAVLVDQQYQEMEVWYPAYRLREAGVRVTVVGPEAGQAYPSKCGYPCVSEAGIDEVKAADFDAVVVPGGWAPDYLRRNEGMIRLVQEMDAAGKLIAAICHAGWLLCSARVLEGRKVTSFIAIRHDMENAGANWVDEETVVDGHLITARKPDDLPAFMRALLGALDS